MSTPQEFNKKVYISLGALAFVAAGIYQGTTMYNKMESRVATMEIEIKELDSELGLLESRMEKRYKRTTDANGELETQVAKQDREIHDLVLDMALTKQKIDYIHE